MEPVSRIGRSSDIDKDALWEGDARYPDFREVGWRLIGLYLCRS